MGSYRGGSYKNGSYARGRENNARRDSRGRYSGDGCSRAEGMIDKLYGLMEDAPDEKTRQEIQRLVSKMETCKKTRRATGNCPMALFILDSGKKSGKIMEKSGKKSGKFVTVFLIENHPQSLVK